MSRSFIRFSSAVPLLAAAIAVTSFAPAAAETRTGRRAVAQIAARPMVGRTSQFDAAVARAWFDELFTLIKSEKYTPPPASRAIGYAGVALYEAVAPGMPGHRSLGGQLNELAALPRPHNVKSLNWPAAANSALAAVMRGLFPSAAAQASINTLAAQIDGDVKASLPTPIYTRSVAYGEAVAAAILAWAAADGMSVFNNCPYTVPTGPGLWIPTPPAFVATPLQACWGQLRPFILRSGGECAPPPPPAFSTDTTSAFYTEANEVYDVSTHLTAEQMAIASFWADNPATTGTPPGHWTSIVGQIVAAHDLSLDVAAEAYARVGIAVADAFVACWDTKYVYNLIRPISYIRQNIDPNYISPVGTPAFPEYTSGHSTQSGAAAFVLEDLFGDMSFTDDTHAGLGLPARSFTSFDQAAEEAAISRLYGGIHYRSAIEKGLAQGECIGSTFLERVRFRKGDHEAE